LSEATLPAVPPSWRFRGTLAPSLRRGLVVALPVGAAALAQLVIDDGYAAGLATAAMIAGFVAFDAPARVRARWQLWVAPAIGLAACLGVLSSQTTPTAVAAMALVGALAGYCVAISLRMLVAGLVAALALLIAQGLYLEPGDAPAVLALGTLGGLAQAGWAGVAWAAGDRDSGRWRLGPALRSGAAELRAGLGPGSTAMRHGIRFGIALGVGVAVYRLVDLGPHGYWVPLTILFVLRPAAGETFERLAMRAAGTLVGLAVATALAELLGEQVLPAVIVLTASAAFAYALLAIEYALFTTAITVYVVLLTDLLGAAPVEAADERGLATAIGIAIAALAFWAWGEEPVRR